MINYPVIYHRDFRHDFPSPTKKEDGLNEKCQRAALAILPFAGLHRPLRMPLSVGMSCVRAYNNWQGGDYWRTGIALFDGAVHFISPTLGFFYTSMTDCIQNTSAAFQKAIIGQRGEALEALAYAAMDGLFLAALTHGSIYLTVAAMVHQIALELYASGKHFTKGEYWESAAKALLASTHAYLAIPQMKVLHWQWQYNPTLTAELKQNEDGFAYLDIPDEYVHSLFEHCAESGAELPPYFKPGLAGAHVSVILSGEMQKGIKAADIGKKFNFRIVHTDTIKPHGWEGVKGVQFLTLDCPELETVREREGLPPRIGGDHDFHLTYAIQK